MAQQNSLQQIIQELDRLKTSTLDDHEKLKQLTVYQRGAVRAYIKLVGSGSPLTSPPKSDDETLIVWERLARALEEKYTEDFIAPIDHIADMHVPAIGENRVIHQAPPASSARSAGCGWRHSP